MGTFTRERPVALLLLRLKKTTGQTRREASGEPSPSRQKNQFCSRSRQGHLLSSWSRSSSAVEGLRRGATVPLSLGGNPSSRAGEPPAPPVWTRIRGGNNPEYMEGVEVEWFCVEWFGLMVRKSRRGAEKERVAARGRSRAESGTQGRGSDDGRPSAGR